MKINEIKKQKPPKVKSPVAKYMNTFNKPATFDDRKAKAKAGYEKHKKDPKLTTESAQSCDHCNGTGKHGEKNCEKCKGTGKIAENIKEYIDDRVGTVVKTKKGHRVKIIQADPKEGVYKVELQNGDTKFMRRKDLDLEVPMDALGKNPIKRMWKHPWDSDTTESINDVFEKTDGAPTDLDDYKAKIKTLYSLERFMKDDPELASEVKRRYRQLAKWKINHDQAESYQSEIYNGLKDIGETATAGSTSAGAIATVANPVIAKHKPAKKGKFGAPKAPQKKKADGTAVNALDMGNNLMGGGAVKR